MSDPVGPLRRLHAALKAAAAAQGIEAIGFGYSLGEDGNPLGDRIFVTFRSDPDHLSVPPEAAVTDAILDEIAAGEAAAERAQAADQARDALRRRIERAEREGGGFLDP